MSIAAESTQRADPRAAALELMTASSSEPRRHRALHRLPGPGVLAAITLSVAVSGFGDTPDPRSTTDDIASYFVRHRIDVFVGVVLVGIALMAMLVVVGGLAGRLHVRGRETTARVAQSSATIAVGVILVGMLLTYAGLSYLIGAEAPGAAKGLFALTILTTPLCAVPLATCLGAIAIGFRRARLGRPWFVWFTGAAALTMAVTACSLAPSPPKLRLCHLHRREDRGSPRFSAARRARG